MRIRRAVLALCVICVLACGCASRAGSTGSPTPDAAVVPATRWNPDPLPDWFTGAAHPDAGRITATGFHIRAANTAGADRSPALARHNLRAKIAAAIRETATRFVRMSAPCAQFPLGDPEPIVNDIVSRTLSAVSVDAATLNAHEVTAPGFGVVIYGCRAALPVDDVLQAMHVATHAAFERTGYGRKPALDDLDEMFRQVLGAIGE